MEQGKKNHHFNSINIHCIHPFVLQIARQTECRKK